MGTKVLLAATIDRPATARIAGALARLGCHVDVLCPHEAPVCHSRYVNLRHPYRALSPLTALRDALSITRPNLAIPCDERALAHMLKLIAQEPQSREAACLARSLGAPQNYASLTSRAHFMDACRELGIAVPETRALERESDLDAALESLGLPAVLKTDGSWGGEGVVIAETREQAHAAWRKLSQPASALRSLARALIRSDAHHLHSAMAKPARPKISIQTYVSGNPATTSFACWQGDVVGLVHTDVVATTSATGPASVVQRADRPAMDEAACAVARRFGLSGLHGLDFMRNAQGKLFLVEINPRATQTSYLAFGKGRDPLCGLVQAASGKNCRPRTASSNNPLVALFPQEWSRNPASPYLKTAFHDIPWDDPDLLRAWLAVTPPAPARPESVIHPPARSRVYGLETLAS